REFLSPTAGAWCHAFSTPTTRAVGFTLTPLPRLMHRPGRCRRVGDLSLGGVPGALIEPQGSRLPGSSCPLELSMTPVLNDHWSTVNSLADEIRGATRIVTANPIDMAAGEKCDQTTGIYLAFLDPFYDLAACDSAKKQGGQPST